MTFDSFGNLSPYSLIITDWKIIESQFVEPFLQSISRLAIYKALLEYLTELKVALGVPLVIWLDGSFTTNKPNPNDVDFVIFVDTYTFQQHQLTIQRFRAKRLEPNSLIDGYFVEVFPTSHTNYFITESDTIEWYHRFSRDRNKRKKGILSFTF
ncbi:hypothetical protein GCM10028808_53710 [Spirosoma migulaei]